MGDGRAAELVMRRDEQRQPQRLVAPHRAPQRGPGVQRLVGEIDGLAHVQQVARGVDALRLGAQEMHLQSLRLLGLRPRQRGKLRRRHARRAAIARAGGFLRGGARKEKGRGDGDEKKGFGQGAAGHTSPSTWQPVGALPSMKKG